MKKKIYKEDSYGFGKVLEEAIKKKFKNQIDFANAIGVTQATVSRYISETASPSFHILHKMSLVLGIDLPILNSKNDNQHISQVNNEMVSVPFFFSEVSAGLGLENMDNSFDLLQFDANWLKNEFMIKNTKNLFTLKVKGDSMEPIIQEGDLVFAKKIEVMPSYQGIYIVSYNNDYLIKKIQFKNKYLIKLISNNIEYDPIEVNLQEDQISFDIVAKVIGRINIKSFTNSL